MRTNLLVTEVGLKSKEHLKKVKGFESSKGLEES
jgi:hypothetical protein